MTNIADKLQNVIHAKIVHYVLLNPSVFP